MSRSNLFCLSGLIAASTVLVSCGSGSSSRASARNAPPPVPTVDVTKVVSQTLNITASLPGELRPYEVVAVYPKVNGFVKWIGVDRGSRVKTGQLMVHLEAPELISQTAEAQARLQSAVSQLAAAEAKVDADESTYQKLKAASVTPGVVAGNDLVLAQKAAEADHAQVKALQDNVNASKQALLSFSEVAGYLQVKAPFDGIVTERNVHPGALVGPTGGPGVATPMVRVETLSHLRLVVPVPENYVAGISEGAKVAFTVATFPGQSFNGTVARVSHAVDVQTRTMPVELDVMNTSSRLAPGMFCEVSWPVQRPQPTLFVPSSAVARTLQRVFVVRIRDEKTEWVDVETGANSGNRTEIFGNLHEGDLVVIRGTDELRPGTPVSTRSD